MGMRQLIKRMVVAFFVIFSGTVISLYVVLLILNALLEYTFMTALSTDELGYMLSISILTNLTQLILYSKKELSRKQLLCRYFIIAFLVVSIVLTVAIFFAEWIDLSIQPLWVVALLVVLIFSVVVIVLMVGSKQTKLENDAYIDHLTKTYNRRYFMEIAAKALDSCIKNNREFSLIMMDLDYFKKVNDTYGHSVGDEVLKIFATRVKHVLKKGTVFVRFGGEEFAVMVVGGTREDTENIAWRIQKHLTDTPFVVWNYSIDVTASFGIASEDDGETLAEIISNADTALYKAKESGRNTVVYYEYDA